MTSSLLRAFLWAGLALAACDEAPPRPQWPAGTALAVDGEPIGAEEIDEIAGWIAAVEPRDSAEQLRRLAVTNVVLPRLAARAAAGPARAEALALARSYADSLAAGDLPSGPLSGPMEVVETGNWAEIGLPLWAAALEAGPGRWSALVESPGAFHLVQLRGTDRDDRLRATIAHIDFLYLDPDEGPARIDRELDRMRLEIVDPSWREVVPRYWIHRMGGSSP